MGAGAVSDTPPLQGRPAMATVAAKLRTGMRTEITARRFNWISDEPPAAGGTDGGPTPYEVLVGGLAACTAITLRWWADRHGVAIDGVDVVSEFDRVHADDCAECEKEQERCNLSTSRRSCRS